MRDIQEYTVGYVSPMYFMADALRKYVMATDDNRIKPKVKNLQVAVIYHASITRQWDMLQSILHDMSLDATFLRS
jgi:hypothetical protein